MAKPALKKRSSRLLAFVKLVLLITALVAAVVFVLKALPPGWWGADSGARIKEVSLEKVVDGDTLWVVVANQRVKVRLIGIDAPELGSAESFQVAMVCAELLESAERLYLEPDSTTPEDKYGRVLGWVWVEQDGERLLLQEELVKQAGVDLYRDARGSDYYHRLELAVR